MPLSRDKALRLRSMGLKTIQVSIDAVNPAIIDTLMQRSGYGEKILDSLDYLGEAGIRVRTHTVLAPLNNHDVPALLTFLAERPFVFKINVTCYGRTLYRHSDDLFVGGGTLGDFEDQLYKTKTAYPP